MNVARPNSEDHLGRIVGFPQLSNALKRTIDERAVSYCNARETYLQMARGLLRVTIRQWTIPPVATKQFRWSFLRVVAAVVPGLLQSA